MKDPGITLPCLVITAEDKSGHKVAIWGKVEDREYMLQTIKRSFNGEVGWRIVKEEPMDWPQGERHD